MARSVGGERLRFAGQRWTDFCRTRIRLDRFGLIAATLWFFTVVYSLSYMAGKAHQRTYYALLVAFSATLGVAFSVICGFVSVYELLP